MWEGNTGHTCSVEGGGGEGYGLESQVRIQKFLCPRAPSDRKVGATGPAPPGASLPLDACGLPPNLRQEQGCRETVVPDMLGPPMLAPRVSKVHEKKTKAGDLQAEAWRPVFLGGQQGPLERGESQALQSF